MDKNTHFQAFLNRALLFDQTHLINTILHAGNHMEYFNSIHNKEEYRVKLSDEEIIGTAEIVAEKQSEIEKELSALTAKIIIKEPEAFQDAFLQRKIQLENDLKLLHEVESKNRYIFQWLLIPHWLGDELISLGEVVFRDLGCNFWGVTNIDKGYLSIGSTLVEIFEELHNY